MSPRSSHPPPHDPDRWRQHAAAARVLAGNARVLADVWAARHLDRRPHFLPIVLAFVTLRCNLHCRACGVEQHPGRVQAELSTARWLAAIESMAGLRTSIISISGGEALLRPDLFDIIAHARQHGISVHLCSNATLIDARVARMLAEAGTHTLSISLDGASADVHDAIRGPGAFEATMAGIQALRTHAPGIRIGINYLVTTRNVDQMLATLALAESLGAFQIKFAPVHTNLLHRDRPLGDYADLMFRTDAQVRHLARQVERLMVAARHAGIQVNPRSYLAGIPDLYRTPRRFRCYAGYAVCAIGPGGEVTPCCDISGGPSLRDESLDRIWRGEAFQTLRQEVRTCRARCWDTTNTELSLRLSLRNLPSELQDTWRALRFYFGKGLP